MKGIPTMRLKPSRVGRMALIVGATGAIAGASLLGATVAKAAPAALGSGPGLTFTPSSGSTSLLGSAVTYNSPACPSGFQGSAILRAVNSDGSTYSVSGNNLSVATPFSGTLLSTISLLAIQQNGDIGAGGTQEILVQCYSGANATGSVSNYVNLANGITWSADGTSWTTAAGPTTTPTTTTLTASPSPASTGQTVTLTATVTATGGTPTGTVSFTVGGSAIGSPVTLDATGKATTTTTFTNPGTVQLAASYTPTGTTFGASASGNVAENVAGPLSEPITLTIAQSGTFNVTVASGTVTLAPASNGATAAGVANPVTVLDSRNFFPGWSVSAQANNFTESTTVKPGQIAASELGWTPTGTLTDATLGPVVAPTTTTTGGLSAAQVWASAAAGHGGTATAGDQISANLLLNIPAGSPAATYGSALSISYTTAAA